MTESSAPEIAALLAEHARVRQRGFVVPGTNFVTLQLVCPHCRGWLLVWPLDISRPFDEVRLETWSTSASWTQDSGRVVALVPESLGSLRVASDGEFYPWNPSTSVEDRVRTPADSRVRLIIQCSYLDCANQRQAKGLRPYRFEVRSELFSRAVRRVCEALHAGRRSLTTTADTVVRSAASSR